MAFCPESFLCRAAFWNLPALNRTISIVHNVLEIFFLTVLGRVYCSYFQNILFRLGQCGHCGLFPFLNGFPGLDNGCFLLEMIPFRARFGSPEAVSINSAKFPFPWRVLFREKPQVSNSGLVLELSDGKPWQGSHFLLKDQTLIFLFSTFFNFPDLSAFLNQANVFLKCHHSPGEFWPKV